MPQTLHYIVDPFDLAGHRLRVTLHMPKVSARDQVVSLPAWIPGSYLIRDFSRHIESIRGRCGDEPGEPWRKPVKLNDHQWCFSDCRDSLTIEIVVYAWDLSVRGAHVDPSHAFFNGTSVFLCPDGLDNAPCVVEIKRPAGKRSWQAYTSMPKAARGQRTKNNNSLGHYHAPDYDALIDHPFELGEPQVIEFKVLGTVHQMVFTGHAPNLDLQRIANDTQKICEAQIRLFDPEKQQAPFLDSSRQYVFMTMVTADGYGGLEHRASTALVCARKDLPVKHHAKAPSGYETFLGLVSHEYFHTWHVKRIKPAKFVPYDLSRPNHTRLLWVFEGFTSYYDDLMLLRAGVITETDYLKLIAKTITNVHNAPGRFKQSLADSSFDAWTKYYKQDENAPNAISSYYAKGSLVAMGLDLLIRIKSAHRFSLDDVMRELWRRFGRDFYAPHNANDAQGLGEDELPALIHSVTGVDISRELDAWVHSTDDVPLAELLAAVGYTLSWHRDDQQPNLGATFKPQGEFIAVRQVIEQGEAHRAGLSAGDVLVALNDLRLGNSVASFQAALAAYPIGSTVTLHFFHGDVLQCAQLRLKKPARATCAIKRNLSAVADNSSGDNSGDHSANNSGDNLGVRRV